MLENEPPIEWVRGDPDRAARFAFVYGISVGGASAIALVMGLSLTGALGWDAFPVIPTLIVLVIVLGLALWNLVLRYLPEVSPVIPKLGISPSALRVGLPMWTLQVPWSRVKLVNRSTIRVAGPIGGRSDYMLTEEQAARLTSFLTSH